MFQVLCEKIYVMDAIFIYLFFLFPGTNIEKYILPKHSLQTAKINPGKIFEILPPVKISLREKFRVRHPRK